MILIAPFSKGPKPSGQVRVLEADDEHFSSTQSSLAKSGQADISATQVGACEVCIGEVGSDWARFPELGAD